MKKTKKYSLNQSQGYPEHLPGQFLAWLGIHHHCPLPHREREIPPETVFQGQVWAIHWLAGRDGQLPVCRSLRGLRTDSWDRDPPPGLLPFLLCRGRARNPSCKTYTACSFCPRSWSRTANTSSRCGQSRPLLTRERGVTGAPSPPSRPHTRVSPHTLLCLPRYHSTARRVVGTGSPGTPS